MLASDPPADFDHLIAECWSAAFPGRPLPPERDYARGGSHHVVLLGADRRWEAMLRWNEHPERWKETARLRYLARHRPPVTIPAPLATVETSRPFPFDRCEVVRPVNRLPLYRYLDQHDDAETQRQIGAQIGQFVAWVTAVPVDGELFARDDLQSADILGRRDESVGKLERHGLSTAQAARLFGALAEMWQTRPALVLCHGDFYPHHAFVDDDGRLGVADWDDSAANEPIRDFVMWYEPFDGFVFRRAYPHAWQAACRAYRPGFPTPDEERRLKLHALAGVFAYDNDPEGLHVADWLREYGADVGLTDGD